jgi:RNA polymerase sigma-70 factor (ECF subfamily)
MVDRDLVVRAQLGDADAFELVVRASLESCYATCVSVLHSPDDARDATQEALVAAWRRLPSLRDPDRFDAWLQTIARNTSRDLLRRRSRLREVQLDASTAELEAPTGPVNGLITIVDRLPGPARQVVTRHYVDDEPVAGIARSLGVPAGTVKSRLFHARTALRALIDKERAR